MAYDLSSIGTYTTAEKIQAVDHAIMSIMIGGQQYSINGRTLGRADLDKLRKYRQELVEQQNEDNGGNIALTKFGDAR